MKYIKLFEEYNENYNEKGTWQYVGNCVSYPYGLNELEQIVEHSDDISFNEFLKATKVTYHYLNNELFPIYKEGRLKIDKDWSVRFYKSWYLNPEWIDISELTDEEEIDEANYYNSQIMEKIPVYYIQHSAIEYIFKKL